MSLMWKTSEASQIPWMKYATPAYIVVSLLIILYFTYNFVVGGVYNIALNNGAQQGYQTAITQLIQQASDEKCQPVEIVLGDAKVQVVNVACLQQAPTGTTPAPTAQTPAVQDEE